MKNIFKRKEKKVDPVLTEEIKKSLVMDLKDESVENTQLHVQGEFLETDEDLGYC